MNVPPKKEELLKDEQLKNVSGGVNPFKDKERVPVNPIDEEMKNNV